MLKRSENPFDLAHLAGLRAWKSRGNEARKLDYLKEMLSILNERGWTHEEKAQLLVFMEGVIHLTEDESSREYEEWSNELEQAKEAGQMYVSIMERKGIAKGRAEGRSEGLAEGRSEGRAETARRMLAESMSVEQISRLTGLSLEEVGRLKD